jgi:hypothetical protein
MKPDDQHLEKIQHQTFQPVFILGFHRSGTSILYKMLSSTDCFNPATAYHLINYDELLDTHLNHQTEQAKKELTKLFKTQGLDDRAIDTLKVTADFAEEYGFFLDHYTNQMNISKTNVKIFKQLCQKIQFIAENNKPILLKNPYDFSNFLFLKSVFPNAKFIFIHRHPLKTISSTISAVSLILQEKNFYTKLLSKTYNKIYENPLLLTSLRCLFSRFSFISCLFLTVYSANKTRFYLNNIEKLSAEDYVSITYEELCKHPQKNITDIMQRLNLTPTNEVRYSEMIKPRKIKLHPIVLSLRKFIYKMMHRYCTVFSYTLDNYEDE